MKDIKDFVTATEGGFTIDTEAYQKELSAELDRVRTQARKTAEENVEKNLRAKLEKEIAEQMEEAAKLSAEEKLKKAMEDFENQKKEFDKQRIKQMYKDANIGDEEIEILCSLIGEDSAKNLETAQKYVDARKAANDTIEKKIKEEIQLGITRPTIDNGGSGENDNIGKKAAMAIHRDDASAKYIDLKPNNNLGVKI